MDEVKALRPIQPEDLFRFRFLQDACFSPDGKKIAYVISKVDSEKDEEHSSIWLMETSSGDSRQLTSGLTRDGGPCWSPDGKTLAFLSARGEKPQIYRIAVDGGEASAVTTLKQGVGSGPTWSPDGKYLAFTAGPEKEPRDLKKPYRVTRPVYRFNGMGYLDDVVQDVYVVAAEGGEARRLTQDGYMNSQPTWSPDSQKLAYTASMSPDSLNFHPALRVVDLNGVSCDLLHVWGSANTISWLPDGERIAFMGNPLDCPVGTQSNIWVVDAKGGTPTCRTSGYGFNPGDALQGDMPVMHASRLKISPDGLWGYIQAQVGGKEQLMRFSLTGPESYEVLIDGECSHALFDMSSDMLLYGISKFNDPAELYLSKLDGSGERQLTQINSGLLAEFKLPEVEHLLFKAVDGVTLEGWLMKPTTGVEAPYPTVLYIHGGPHAGFGYIFSFDFQMLAGAGYAVLFLNQRGSTGYGDEFANKIIGDWGNLDYKDLMSGVDTAIEKGLTDGDRLGVCGISGGGNLSCWIVGQTDRFKAAVPENPVTNWVSMYGVSDVSAWLGPAELGGKPHEMWETYLRCSPITYAHNCKTPTLLVQGEEDYRCPAEQSEQFYTVLKANGCTVEMLRLPFSSHVASIAGAVYVRKAQNEALLGWMNRYVLGIKEEEKEQA